MKLIYDISFYFLLLSFQLFFHNIRLHLHYLYFYYLIKYRRSKAFSYFLRNTLVLLAKATKESITGTFAKTPITVAKAAPKSRPDKLIATATDSARKFDVPIRDAGAAMLYSIFHKYAQRYAIKNIP